MRVTGERIVTRRGGFNASWQRHAACYGFCNRFLGPEPVLDVGCGLGHAYDRLAPRDTIGVDIDAGSLVGQARKTVAADMRWLPFPSRAFATLLSVHSIEHVPDPEKAVNESSRVLDSGGIAIFVTPNRLTFGRPDEIIDPYHYVEFDPDELASLCSLAFSEIELYGIFGSDDYMEFFTDERRQLESLLRKDPLRLRRFLPRRTRQTLYDWKLSRSRRDDEGPGTAIREDDFELRNTNLNDALDLFAVCRNIGAK